MELELLKEDDGPNYRIVARGGTRVQVRRGERAEPQDASDFFYDDPQMIWFPDGSALEGNDFIPLEATHPPYDPTKILAWDWSDERGLASRVTK
jgi:hypothetical protein